MIEYKVNESFYEYNDYEDNFLKDDKDVYVNEDDLRCGVCKIM